MKKIITLCLLLVSVMMFSQQTLKKADKLFNQMAYKEAAKTYEEYLENAKKPLVSAYRNAADSYYFLDDNVNALKWYKKLYQVQNQSLTDEYFRRYLQSLRGVRDYDTADQLTREFLKQKGDEKEIERYVSQKKYADSLEKAPQRYAIRNLEINSPNSDFGTAFYGDKVVYSSTKDSINFDRKLYTWNEQPFLDLYITDRNSATGALFNETFFLQELRTKYHTATVTFSKDLNTIYYTTNTLKKKKLLNDAAGTNNFHIMKGTLENGKIIKSESVPFNSTDYSVGHPSLSPDGKWLFFASDMPGGYGSIDIYVVELFDDGTMGPVKNLGPTINTIGRDMFPFFSNGILYFSSDGYYGYGGLDVYESNFSGKMNFSAPRSLGKVINSNKDDFSFIIDSTDTYGYFSSNRAGGKGDDDIYSFTKTKAACDQLVSGKVTTVKSKEPVEGATIKVYDLFETVMQQTTSDKEGNYHISLPCAATYRLEASKQNYSTKSQKITTVKANPGEMKGVDFELDKLQDLIIPDGDHEKIDINTIFFDYNKATITPQATVELDKVVYAMTQFPTLRIKIESHTDSRGKDAYNLKLSNERAKATAAYIFSKGIAENRIESAIGYGETRLLNTCGNHSKCTEAEHSINRRSDFIIVAK
ncbi:OmpA family protein [Flavobacterium kingsejongi]|uniref:Flagellar motor protein MotB n=1 Tax=Flavobacterium kingsejongi TaxID=1678728 RepID=A0A2S1LSM6_9FLAO|nr:OmpA family protein [Flavobacterium kingsejongi]AWG26765.1 flagellar motor protein MotB [Flavobacterium kingsejongi]